MPISHASMRSCSISSTVVSSGTFTVFDMAPEKNGWMAAIIRRCPM